MASSTIQIKHDTDFKPHGLFINQHNIQTLLYQEIIRNQLENPLYYFSDFNQSQYCSKWLFPLCSCLSFLDNFQCMVGPLKNVIEEYNGYYFFDLSAEAIPYEPIDNFFSQKFKSFHHMLESNNIDPEKVYFVNANLVADRYYDAWREKSNIKYKIANKMLTHQSSLGNYSEAFRKYFLNDNLFHKNIELALLSIRQRIKRKYYFTSLMLRPRFHRTAIMLHLLDRELLGKGICSYFGEEFGNKSTETVETIEQTYHIISKLSSGKRLLSRWDKLTAMGSIHIDSTLTTIKECGWAPKDMGFFPRSFIEDTSSLNTRSYFEIVTETHFTNETCLYITEKTLWPIVSLQPFIIVGSPFSLQYLRELGFLTFSPYIDESYDTESDPQLRIELIMKEIDRLCSLSLDEIHDLYTVLWPRILHNYYHYFNYSKALASSEIQKRIVAPINLR